MHIHTDQLWWPLSRDIVKLYSFLGLAGIDITVFTAHSTRKASSSKGNNMGITLKDISKAAGWRNNSTFAKHYKLPIIKKFGKNC